MCVEQIIIAATDSLFDAMRSRDVVAMRAAMHPQAQFTSIRIESREVRVRSGEEFIAAIAASESEMDERLVTAIVHSDGDLATLWAPYEFRIGGNFSHRGTDSFQFLRSGDRWLLISATYTLRA